MEIISMNDYLAITLALFFLYLFFNFMLHGMQKDKLARDLTRDLHEQQIIYSFSLCDRDKENYRHRAFLLYN